jgi:toxin ParE1/3/4
MHAVEWTGQAEADLEGILEYYLERAGLRVVQDIYSRIKEQVGSLTIFPHRCRPGRVAGTKEYVLSRLPFIAIVEITDDTVFILNLVHTARKYPPN